MNCGIWLTTLRKKVNALYVLKFILQLLTFITETHLQKKWKSARPSMQDGQRKNFLLRLRNVMLFALTVIESWSGKNVICNRDRDGRWNETFNLVWIYPQHWFESSRLHQFTVKMSPHPGCPRLERRTPRFSPPDCDMGVMDGTKPCQGLGDQFDSGISLQFQCYCGVMAATQGREPCAVRRGGSNPLSSTNFSHCSWQ